VFELENGLEASRNSWRFKALDAESAAASLKILVVNFAHHN
jgi:hypothetical protein